MFNLSDTNLVSNNSIKIVTIVTILCPVLSLNTNKGGTCLFPFELFMTALFTPKLRADLFNKSIQVYTIITINN